MEILKQQTENDITVRITCGYGIATNYVVKNECPKCGAKLKKNGEHHGCYDGEWTWVDKITCDNGCFFYYGELREANGYE